MEIIMKNTLKGYMTVEISMLFPIIFITICMLFYMCFYFHDRVTVQAFLYRFGIHAYHQGLTEKECEERLRKGIEERMVMSKLLSVRFSGTDWSIKAEADLNMGFPWAVWKNSRFCARATIDNLDKSGSLRKIRMLREVTG